MSFLLEWKIQCQALFSIIDYISPHEPNIEEVDDAIGFSESQDKNCAICLESTMMKQPPSDRMFGLMINCKHVFCLSCIRKWRSKRREFSESSIRSCPICSIESGFVVPSKYWIEDNEEKTKIILRYQETIDAEGEVSEPSPASELEAQIGDLIQINRPRGREWVIYVGDGNVIHLNNDQQMFIDIWKFHREKLTVVAKKYFCQVNNLINVSHYLSLEPRPINEVMKSVYSDVDQKRDMPYDSLEKNSLHFVTKWRFGTSFILHQKPKDLCIQF